MGMAVLALARSPAARAEVTLEPDGDRFGTVRADGARIAPGRWWDPYGPNVLKGDRPFAGAKGFVVLTGIVDAQATSLSRKGDSTTRGISTVLVSAEVFRGQTVFRPKSIGLRLTGLARHQDGGEDDFAPGESFLELLLLEHGGASFDSTSLRAGVQAVNLDVQGLVVNDLLLGGRVFSEFSRNRYGVSVLWGRPLEKDAVSALGKEPLEADIAAAVLTVGDAFVPGLNLTATLAADVDRRVENEPLDVAFVAVALSGHLGRVVTAPAIYLAAGRRKDAAGTSHQIVAPMGVLDFALPANAWTPRLTLLWAPADREPGDDNDTAYDAIADRVAFAGAGGAGNLAGAGRAGVAGTLFRKGSVIPSLRGANAPPNFVHGGVRVIDVGVDLALTHKLAASFDVAHFRFDEPATVSTLTGTDLSSDEIGTEGILQLRYKPFLNENALVVLSAAMLSPGNALEELGAASGAETKIDGRILLAF